MPRSDGPGRVHSASCHDRRDASGRSFSGSPARKAATASLATCSASARPSACGKRPSGQLVPGRDQAAGPPPFDRWTHAATRVPGTGSVGRNPGRRRSRSVVIVARNQRRNRPAFSRSRIVPARLVGLIRSGSRCWASACCQRVGKSDRAHVFDARFETQRRKQPEEPGVAKGLCLVPGGRNAVIVHEPDGQARLALAGTGGRWRRSGPQPPAAGRTAWNRADFSHAAYSAAGQYPT